MPLGMNRLEDGVMGCSGSGVITAGLLGCTPQTRRVIEEISEDPYTKSRIKIETDVLVKCT